MDTNFSQCDHLHSHLQGRKDQQLASLHLPSSFLGITLKGLTSKGQSLLLYGPPILPSQYYIVIHDSQLLFRLDEVRTSCLACRFDIVEANVETIGDALNNILCNFLVWMSVKSLFPHRDPERCGDLCHVCW